MISTRSKPEIDPTQEIVSTVPFSASHFPKVDASEDRLRRYHDFLKNHRKSPEKISEVELPDSGSVNMLGMGTGSKKQEDRIFSTGDDHRMVEVTKRTIYLKPESVLFLTQVEGVAKNLLLYLLVTQEEGHLDFVWTNREIGQFQEFFMTVDNKKISEVAIEKAMKSLKDINAVKCLHRGHNILNPLLMTPKGTDLQSCLINFATRGIERISRKVFSTKGFIRRHLLPKTKTVKKTVKEVTFSPEENRVAS